jgi:GT2 family glycosyltransferase
MTHLAIIAIGRNEGDRLKRCLSSLLGQAERLIYVDSGSADGSVDAARALGAEIVELDPIIPFTAARARNAGVEALGGDLPELIHFIDGDCEMEPGWIGHAKAAMIADPALGIVTGWRAEMHPYASIYNAMCDHEWHRPAGPITACGGDMLARATAFRQTGGFNTAVIAAEDDEFCLRVAKAGFTLIRLPQAMTRHDADMHRFSQWWRRSVRNGHGFAQLGTLHPNHLARERMRVLVFAAVLPVLAVIGLIVTPWLFLGVLAIYLGSYLHTVIGLVGDEMGATMAAHQGLFLSLSKFPNLIGMITFYLRKWRGREITIIEYK